MSGVTSGGGGGALHQDGEPVSVQLGPSESITVPTGETWRVSISVAPNAGMQIGSVSVAEDVEWPTTLTGGQTVSETQNYGSDGMQIGGWSL